MTKFSPKYFLFVTIFKNKVRNNTACRVRARLAFWFLTISRNIHIAWKNLCSTSRVFANAKKGYQAAPWDD